jgi:hypothetical protein
MTDNSWRYKQCETLHVPSGRRCQYAHGHSQPHFARVENLPVEWGNAELEVLFACNEGTTGVFKGHFQEVAFMLRGETLAILEGRRLTVEFKADHVLVLTKSRQLDCARTDERFAASCHLHWAGNWCWDSVRMHEDIARVLFVSLIAEGYEIMEGATEGPLAALIEAYEQGRKAAANG